MENTCLTTTRRIAPTKISCKDDVPYVFKYEGIVNYESLPRDTIVNQQYYLDISAMSVLLSEKKKGETPRFCSMTMCHVMK